ncbi:polyribonucleotide nucleotidyltransferase [Phaeocystidibacter luteus]|uniref:Polyribonucleotide nucleotidyltransferase n=1 Tax=Phaeocystidibacter luteus TaxID=911197 RepID=A0A6N6RH71_9FLAO|nr:polyribonucleotide nucleotidyltransferase [Phaeocystidibacter luteus]KAB2809815.1 polyribonucleotide nucleotidyltransferase [Phaeocystidibacter luteus]
MIPTPTTQEIKLADGRVITLETGKLARQADGSVVVKMGGTMLLATVVSNKDAKEGVDFLPLTVEYREKFSATGRVPGGFIKREGRPSDDEILTMRLVDRVLRPIFPKDYHADTQVIINLISFDPEVAPDSLAGLAASAAISISDIPFNGPIGEVRVARIDGELVINPSPADKERADIEMMIGGSKESIVMVEGEMEEVSEEEMLEAIEFAHKAIIDQCIAQEELASKVAASSPKREYNHETHDEELREAVMKATYDKCYEIAKQGNPNKHERSAAFKEVFEAYIADWSEEDLAEKAGLAKTYFHDAQYHAVRNCLLDNGIRLDGRKTTEIRPIWTEVDYLPGGHGSAIFTRGETQSLTTVTLGTSLDVNKIDNATFVGQEKFYLHYNFPPFSTGEARPIRGTSRREIGHGNLAQRALKKMIPADSPYTIRIVSEILESNGSSSMATVCAGTLSLMDAGINIKKPVSGIAMGLITDKETGKYQILSDILGDEDHLGDMDFKVTGTRDGITACQMDLKITGISAQVMKEALAQAREGRLHIMTEMTKSISEPRTQLKANAPKIVVVEIPKSFIGAVIGPGGKVIQALQEETGTTISIEEEGEKGKVEISGVDQEGMDFAIRRIKDIAFVPTVGETYEGVVKGIQSFGAFIEIGHNTQGLLHISEIDHKRIEEVTDVFKEGDKVQVKLLAMDEKGKMKLSRKALLPKPEKQENKQ